MGGESSRDARRVRELALPHHQDAPAPATQLALHTYIPNSVARELGLPERSVGPWVVGQFAPAVSVPKAAVDEDDLPKAGERQIRHARKIASVEAESKAESMCQSTHYKLGVRILATDTGHQGRTFLARQNVH